METNGMKCFISREYSVSSEILISIQEVLDELNIQYYDMFPVQGGMAISEAIYTAIHDSDIVIAVITKSSSNVLFELGLAIGLGKAVFLLVDDSDYIPADLHGRLYIKINENLKENLTLPLRFFVDKKRKKTYVDYTKFYLSGVKDVNTSISENMYLEKLEEIKQNGDGFQFENLVAELFGEIKEQYTTINFRPASEDKRYDFAVWIDELDGHIINPIKFELKFGNISVGQLNSLVSQVIAEVKSQELVLILYCNKNNETIDYQSVFPNIVVVEFEKFLKHLCKSGLARTIWYFRNLGAHGRSCQNDSL